jgi:hypothetical protein
MRQRTTITIEERIWRRFRAVVVLEAIRKLLGISAELSRSRPAVMESRAGTWSKSV